LCEAQLFVTADCEGSKISSRTLGATRLPKDSKSVYSNTKVYFGHRSGQRDCDVKDEDDIEDNDVVAR
jgi:hypothetical protein